MLKVLLLVILANSNTGELQFARGYPYETMAECQEVASNLPKPPAGSYVSWECIEPGPNKIKTDLSL